MKGRVARILFGLVVDAMGAVWMPQASAESAIVDGVEWVYSLDGSGNATVTGGGPDAGVLDIPSSLGGHPVTAIGIGAFASRAGLTAVAVPGGVTNIARQAFGHCTGMVSLSLPDGLANLELEACRECSSLRELAIPGSVENIDSMAFYFCTNLVSLAFGDGVKKIGYNAFFYCHELTSVEIPDSVTTIQDLAFGTCPKLASVRLGRGLVDMAPRAFHYATALSAFEMDSGNPAYTVVDGVVYTKDMKNLVEVPRGKTGVHAIPDGVETVLAGGASYSELESFVFPDSLAVIEENAFFGCSNMVSVSLGPAVTNIGRDAFTYCDSLAEIRVDPGNPAFSSVDGVLFDKAGTCLLACPGAMAGVYEVPAGVETICSHAFRYCRHLTCAVFPEGLQRIESNAFDGCTLLETVVLPSSVESVGAYAFGICPALSSVTFSERLTTIGNLAFYRCPDLTSLVLPESVKEIGSSVFSDCSSLVTLCVPAAWKGTSILARAGVPPGCTVIYGGKWTCEVDAGGNGTLLGAPDGVARLAVPPAVDGHPVAAIGSAAFSGHAELEYLRLPDGVDEVGPDAFGGTGLVKLSVPGTWEGGSRLDGVSLPEGCLVLYRGEPFGDPRYADWAGGIGVAAADLPAEGDPDGDGATNREEFVAGTDPLDGSEFLRLAIAMEGGRIDLAASPSRDDRTYTHSGTKSMLLGEDGWVSIPAAELENLRTTSPGRFFKVQVEYPQAE